MYSQWAVNISFLLNNSAGCSCCRDWTCNLYLTRGSLGALSHDDTALLSVTHHSLHRCTLLTFILVWTHSKVFLWQSLTTGFSLTVCFTTDKYQLKPELSFRFTRGTAVWMVNTFIKLTLLYICTNCFFTAGQLKACLAIFEKKKKKIHTRIMTVVKFFQNGFTVFWGFSCLRSMKMYSSLCMFCHNKRVIWHSLQRYQSLKKLHRILL